MDLATPIQEVPLIGTAFAKKLAKLEIYTVKDLLFHIPFRYEDTATITPIGSILPYTHTNQLCTIQGTIEEIETIYTRYGKKLTQAVITDATGSADIIWFNQPYLAKSLPKGTLVLLSGKVTFDTLIRPKFIAPSYERIGEQASIHLGKLTPIYPETQGISSKWLRSRIHEVLQKIRIDEWLPEAILVRYHFIGILDALKQIHFPKNIQEQEQARARLAFDEMFLIQLIMEEKRLQTKQAHAIEIAYDEAVLDAYLQSLPFMLTQSQKQSITEILTDLHQTIPMNRLLEGEVGSGKTVVAGAAIHHIIKAGGKVSLMAPTSILAKQHYDTLIALLTPLGVEESDISLITNKSKRKLNAKVFVGTQALLFQQEIIDTISLAIIDEQHRFGVHQREKLVTSTGHAIHSLTMTATPIPRTLALSIYGDLDISYINELPKGRQAIITRIVPEKKREDLYQFTKQQLNEKRQAFIICPLVSLSDKLNVKSAEEEFQVLQNTYFKDYKLVLLHGQMKAQEKDAILLDFKEGKYDILVSTPVVEVGIDIPNATIMIIEGAERFGLAQLHQLRGRVGRGIYTSYCFLLTSEEIHQEKERLKVFAVESSGLKIAEFDLQNRGPGEVYGIRQSGIPTLKIASLLDIDLITKTRKEAELFFTSQFDTNSVVWQKVVQFKEEIQNLN